MGLLGWIDRIVRLVSPDRRVRISKRQHIENLRAAIRRGDRKVDAMVAEVPPNRVCCDTCYLNACVAGYPELIAKQEQRRRTLLALTKGAE